MDNSIPKDSPAFNIAAIMQNAQELIDKVKTGDGLGLTEEQKAEFHKQMAEKGSDKAIQELKNKLEALKDAAQNMGQFNPSGK